MNDKGLLAFGCVVSFITVAGAYVYLRGRLLSGVGQDRSDAVPSQAEPASVQKT